VLKAGEGASPKANEVFELGLAFYNKSGKMIQAQLDPSQLLKASADKMNLPFLKEGPLLMSAGAEFWFEVPAKLAWGAQSPGPDIGANETTYWYLKMVRVVKPLPLPKFELPGDDELTKTASGLKYKVLREGKGDSPKAFQTVKVHYCGWQTDGKNFDSSYSRGEPTSFPLNRVIKGWTEGVQLMKPGAKYLFVIPGRLAYGDPVPGQPSGGRPLGTLVFVVELLEIVR
jgi:FKBP-type peptidyl-prolyl cis-trans isomerase